MPFSYQNIKIRIKKISFRSENTALQSCIIFKISNSICNDVTRQLLFIEHDFFYFYYWGLSAYEI